MILANKDTASQTRIKDCAAAKFNVTSGEVDQAFIDSKEEKYWQDIVDTEEYTTAKKAHKNKTLT